MLCFADCVFQYHHAELITNLMKPLGPINHRKCNNACLPHFIVVAHSDLLKVNQVWLGTFESMLLFQHSS